METTSAPPEGSNGGRWGGLDRFGRGVARRWQHLSLQTKGAIVIAIPLATLLVSALLTYWVDREQEQAVALVVHTHEVRVAVQEVFTLVTEASTGVRGYLLTSRNSFLEPYNQATARLPASVATLSQLVEDNPIQTTSAERVKRLTDDQLRRLEALRTSAARLSPSDVNSRLVANKAVLDDLRGVLRTMTTEEDHLLNRRTAALSALQEWQRRTTLVGFAVGIGGGLVAMLLFLRGIVRRVEYVETNARQLARGETLQPPLPGRDAISRLSEALHETAKLLTLQTGQLRESEGRLRDIVSNAPVVLQALDADGVFTFSEGKGLSALGRQPGELVGRSVFEVYRHTPQILENNRRALLGEQITSTVDIADLTFETRYLPTFADGRVSGVVIVATDVTERKRAEDVLVQYQDALTLQNEELLRMAQLKDEFFAKVSHELRTPLTAVIGFFELLMEDDQCVCLEGNSRREYAGMILESAHHLLALINDLLDLSKIEAGMMKLQETPVDLFEAVANALAIVEGQARKKELRVDTRLPAKIAPLSADARKVKQILYNLLSNAVKYTPAHGYIQLAVFDEQSEVRVEVRDTGPGIAPEDQDKLFQPFTQLQTSDTDAGGAGTGLGLAVTKQLVELHGGRVWLRSRTGEGSTFGFSLPRTKEKPSAMN